MKLIGIAGTNGSGKDSLGEILAKDYGWLFVSVTEILREELRQRGQPIERENLRTLSAEWRRQFGHGILVDKALKIYEPQESKYKGLVVASLRNPGEVDEIHKLAGVVVWLDADPKTRYKRTYSRARSREDKKTFEQFLEEEAAEMRHSGDGATLNMSAVKAKADIFLNNDSNNLKTFKTAAQKALSL